MALPVHKRDDRARTARIENALDRARSAWPPAEQCGNEQREKEYIDKLMAQREARKPAGEKQQAYKTDKEATFSVGEYADPRQALTTFLYVPAG